MPDEFDTTDPLAQPAATTALAEPPPTMLEIAQGDRTTVSEPAAYAALQALKYPSPALDQVNPLTGKTVGDTQREALRSYADERRRYGRPLFPTFTAEDNRKRAEWHRGLFTKPLDQVLDPVAYARMESRAKQTSDPDRYRARMVLKSYFNDVLGGKIAKDSFNRFRMDYARQHLGLTASEATDTAVFAALQKRFGEEAKADKDLDLARRDIWGKTFEHFAGTSRQPRTLSKQVTTPAEQVTQNPDGSLTKTPTTSTRTVDEPQVPAAVDIMAEWQKIAPSFPEHLRDSARDAFLREHRTARRTARRIKPTVDAIEDELRFLIDYSRDQSGEFAALGDVWRRAAGKMPDDPNERSLVKAALARRMESWPYDERSTLQRHFGEIERITQIALRGTYTAVLGEAESLAKGVAPKADFTGDLADIARLDAKRQDLQSLVYRTGGSHVTPYDNFLQRGVILAGGSIPYIAASLSPAGVLLSAVSFAGNNYAEAVNATPVGLPLAGIGNQEQRLRNLRGNQLNAAMVSGGVEASIERATTVLGMRWMKGKFPTVAALMTRAGVTNPAARAAIGGASTLGAVTSTEYLEETAQDASNRFTQDLALRLSGIQPNTNWGKFFADWSPTSPKGRDTLAAVSILALVGGGGASFSHFKDGQQLRQNAELLRAMGVPEEQVKTITLAEDSRLAERALRDAFDKGLEERPAEVRQTYLDTLDQEQKAWSAVGWGNVTEDFNTFTEETTHTFTPPDGTPAQTFDNRADALMAWRSWALADHESAFDTIQQAANSELLDFLTGEGSAAEGIRVEETGGDLTPTEAVRRGFATREQMQARLEVFALQQGKAMADAARDFDSLRIRARRFSESARDGSTRRVLQLFDGADPLNIIEDLAEDTWSRAIEERLASPEQLVGWVRDTEETTGNSYLARDYQHDAAQPLKLLEALSAISREYALDRLRVDGGSYFPPKFRQWLDMMAGLAAATLGAAREILHRLTRGKAIATAFEDGRLSPKFRTMVEDSIGLNTAATEARLRSKMEEQLAAEAMEGFPEIAASLRGQLPHPETAAKNRSPLAGELRRIWDGLKRPTRRKRKDGATVDGTQAANAYFLPIGEVADLDEVRQRMNAKGFDFDTPADMLDALDSSLNYDRPVYGTTSRGSEEPSFALGEQPPGAQRDGTRVIDSSFAIGVSQGFFSQLERTVEAKIPDNATPAQIMATVDPARGTGVKAEEIKWSGLEVTVDRLAAEHGGKVPKAALLERLRNEGRVLIYETTLATDAPALSAAEAAVKDAAAAEFQARTAAFAALESSGVNRVDRFNLIDALVNRESAEGALARAMELAPGFDWQGFQQTASAPDEARAARDALRTDKSKFGEFSLPGGTNYREIILSMPEQGRVTYTPESVVSLPDSAFEASEPELFWYFEAPGQVFQIPKSRFSTASEARDFIIREKQPEAPVDQNFTSRHFEGVPNYLAHLRLDDRTDATGREGTFIEELQSDRHQEARRKRYREDQEAEFARLIEQRDQSLEGHEREAIQTRINQLGRGELGVPDAPFRKDWPLQLVKRALREAVASGKAWIGWTTGQTQADRFDISKQIDTLEYRPETGRLYAYRDGNSVIDTQVKPERLPDIIGKEAAERLLATTPVKSGSGLDVHRLEGEALKVGGEGMAGFYDRMLPADIGKYVRQWGGKVESGNLQPVAVRTINAILRSDLGIDPTQATHEQRAQAGEIRQSESATGPAFHRIAITDAMRESVAQGQPSFALAPKNLARLEEAIARKMTQGPAERAEFYERMRNRLASTLQRFEDSENGVGPFARRATEDLAEAERRRIIEAMAEAQAIISALPPEVRGRVTIPTAELLANKSERGKVNAFKRLIDDADDALELHLRKEYADAIETLFDQAKPNLSASRQLAGKLTPETQRLVDQALAAALLTPVQLGAEIQTLETRIAAMEDGGDAENPPGSPGHIEALQAHDLLETFGAVNTRSAAEMAQAYEQLLSIYTKGRTARRVIEEAKRSELADMRRQILDQLGRPSQPQYSKRTADTGTRDYLDAFRLGLSSFHQVMEDLFPGSPVARHFQEGIRKADRAFTRARLDAVRRFEGFMASAFSATTKRQRDKILAKLSTRHDTWHVELREGTRFEETKLTPEQAAAVLDGSIKPGWHTDPIAMESLRQALADFRLARRQEKSQAKFVRFQRLTNRGAAAWLHMSELEALYITQLHAQAEYRPALDRYGFTESVVAAIAAKIDPRAQRVGSYLAREYDAGYDRLNPVFRELYGFDMPRIRNYAPGIFEHATAKAETPLDAFGGTQNPVNGMSAGFTKSRQHHMARPRQANALAAYWAHIEQAEYFIAYGQTVREMRAVFQNPDVRRSIEGTRGTRVASLFSQWMDAIQTDARLQATNLLTISEASTNALATQAGVGLAFNFGVLLKQISAGTGTLYTMPIRSYVKGLVGVLRDPASLKALWETETIRQRIEQGFSPEDRKLLDASRAKPSLILDLLSVGRLPIAWVDAALTTLSGSIAYKFHLEEARKAGLSAKAAEEFALQQFDRAVLETAQPATTQDKSLGELTATNAVARAMIMFRSDPRQKAANAWNTLHQLAKGRIGKGEAARKILVGWVLYGLLAQAASDIWLSMSRDEERSDLWDWKKYLASAIAGPITGVTYLGTALDFGLRKLITGKAYSNNPSPVDAAMEGALRMRLVDTVQTLMEDREVSANEIMEAIVADSRNFALVAGVKDPRFAIAAVLPRAIRDLAGLTGNTVDLVFGESDAERKRAVLAETGQQGKETREQQTEDRADQLKAFLRASPDKQEQQLKQLDHTDRRTATRFRQARALRQLPAEDRQLARLDTEARAGAIRKFLEMLPAGERPAYLEKLKAAGILSRDTEDALNTPPSKP